MFIQNTKTLLNNLSIDSLSTIFSRITLNRCLTDKQGSFGVPVRFVFQDIEIPKPGRNNYFRRIVHYPEKYTIKSLRTTNLAGRDPKTGRVVVGTLGGGIKHPYLWVDYKRLIPKGDPPLIERVIEIMSEPNRTADIALVGHKDSLRYIIATANMKVGDTIVTSSELTRSAVRANEGDAYPVGSLPAGTEICCLEAQPGRGGFFARAGASHCVILRRVGQFVFVGNVRKQEVVVDANCIAVVGRVKQAYHATLPIGSAMNLRRLGYRPRSGLWQRKTGKHGRKIRPPPPIWDLTEPIPEEIPITKLTLDSYPHHYD